MITESPSFNHAGVYDYATLGILNAIESFASGNWIETPAHRNAWKVIFAPLWIPLNLVRAAFGVVATAFSTVPMAFIHRSEIKKQVAREVLIAKELVAQAAAVVEANQAKPGSRISLTTLRIDAPQESLAERASRAFSAIVLPKSRALNETTFDKAADGDAHEFTAQLLATPVSNANAYWKVIETSKVITAQLVQRNAKHPEKYSNLAVALPSGLSKTAAAAQAQSRISSTIGVGALSHFEPATIIQTGDSFAATAKKATKKDRKHQAKSTSVKDHDVAPKKSFSSLLPGKKAKPLGVKAQKSNFNLFNKSNPVADPKEPSKKYQLLSRHLEISLC